MYRSLTACAGMSLLCALSAANAESGLNPALNETFSFRLGGAYLSGSASVGADLKGGTSSPDISLDDLGVDADKWSPYFNARWRFADSFSAKFEYFGWQEDGSGIATADIEFEDITIPAGLRAHGDFDVDVYAVSLGWAFLKDPRYEMGVGLGLHIADLNTSIEGAGFIGNVPTQSARGSTSVTAPLPNISLYGSYALTPKIALEATVGYFSLSYDKYDGELLVAAAALEYRFNERFGVGAGYSLFDIDLTVDNDRTTDRYNFDLHGPVIYLSAGF